MMLSVLLFVQGCSGTSQPKEFGPMVAIQNSDGRTFYIDVYEFPNKQGTLPLAEMDFKTAKESCAKHDKRLCTMEEWKIACGQTRFTYGDDFEQNRCYTNQQNEEGHTSLMHGRTSQIPSGSRDSCQSPTGIFDMNGNVEEWVLDDWRNMEGNLAGGAWYTNWRYADCDVRYSREPDYRLAQDRPTDSAGVRCCWSEWEITDKYITADADLHRKSNASDVPSYNPNNEALINETFWMDQYEYPNVKSSFPLVGVSWDEATKLCKESGKDLCSVEQWEMACSNNDTTGYSYGNRHHPNKCNDEGNSLIPSGSKDSCRTQSTVFDLIGNVWEWTSSDLTVAELQTTPNIPVKEIRGGSFVSDSLKARCKPKIGYPLASADTKSDTLGFRCCRNVDARNDVLTLTKPEYADYCPDDMQPHANGCVDQFEFPNKEGVKPTHSVTLTKAKDLCSEVGKHLCTASEWSTACQGPEKRRWSYGQKYSAKRCHHASKLHHGGVKPAGLFAECKTPEGIYDMTGNLWEWDASGSLRGGNWNFSEGMGQCLSTAKPAPHIHNDEIGLRCCATIQEAHILLTLTERE